MSSQWNKQNAERMREINRACYARTRDQRPEVHKLRKRKSALRPYGLSVEAYEAMYARQGGHCGICDLEYEILSVDHDHITGNIRGLLCKECNKGIGALQDEPRLLHRALEHLNHRVNIPQQSGPCPPEFRNKHNNMRRKFGLSYLAWKWLYDAQEGRCAICDRHESQVKWRYNTLTVDHCHDTGAIRGLLCYFCNLGTGQLKDDPKRLKAAIQYLETSYAVV